MLKPPAGRLNLFQNFIYFFCVKTQELARAPDSQNIVSVEFATEFGFDNFAAKPEFNPRRINFYNFSLDFPQVGHRGISPKSDFGEIFEPVEKFASLCRLEHLSAMLIVGVRESEGGGGQHFKEFPLGQEIFL